MDAAPPGSLRKYSRLRGISGVPIVPPLSKQTMMIAGRTGVGKTAFIQSCPTGYIINTDLCGVTTPHFKATIWPAVSSDMRPCEAASPREVGAFKDEELSEQVGFDVWLKPVEMTWDAVLEQANILVSLAKQNVPDRPEIVFLDTVDSTIRMLQPWVAAKYGKDSFDALHGKLGWPAIWDEVTGLCRRLTAAGYGFVYVLHLTDKIVYENQEASILRNIPRITDNFSLQIQATCGICGVIDITEESCTEKVPLKDRNGNPILNAQGKPRTRDRVVTERVHTLSFDAKVNRYAAKNRVGLTDFLGASKLRLPLDDGWGAFANAYNSARKAFIERIKSDMTGPASSENAAQDAAPDTDPNES